MSYIFFGGFSDDSEHVKYVVAHSWKWLLFIDFFFPLRYSFDTECACDSIFRTFRCASVSRAGEEREIFRVFSIRFSSPSLALSIIRFWLVPALFAFHFSPFVVPISSSCCCVHCDWLLVNHSELLLSYLELVLNKDGTVLFTHTIFFCQCSTELSSRHKETSSALSIIFSWIFRSYQDEDSRRARKWRWRVTSNFFLWRLLNFLIWTALKLEWQLECRKRLNWEIILKLEDASERNSLIKNFVDDEEKISELWKRMRCKRSS